MQGKATPSAKQAPPARAARPPERLEQPRRPQVELNPRSARPTHVPTRGPRPLQLKSSRTPPYACVKRPPEAPPAKASDRPGMGAIPYDGGTTFRVWAPNAQRLQVSGEFSDWKAVDLVREPSGNWSLDIPGAKHGQQYQYVIQGKYGDWRWKGDPRAADVTNSTGNSVIYDQKAYQWKHDWDFKMPAWNEMVVYEMHVGSFHDEPGWGPGNWQSAIDKLDHLKDLGINVVEVMPSAEFAGDFSWGYNPAYPFAPESAYGSPDDLKRFVDEAHKRGIGVVMDVVYNHLGPSDLPHWDFDGETYGAGGNYFYPDWRAETPWGHTRPDYGRPEVRDYLRDNAMMWLRDYHMDGLRLDATYEMRMAKGQDNPQGWQVMKEINDAVNREFPQKIVIAEDLQSWDALTDDQGANFDSQWDAQFVHPIRRALTAYSDSDRDMNEVAKAITYKYNGEATNRVIFSESHDEAANGKQRIPSEVGGWDSGGWHAKKRSTLGSAVTLTSPGIPMLLQGQEFLEDGSFAAEDPLDWRKSSWNKGIENMHRDLIRLRRNWYDNTAGLRGQNANAFHVNNTDKVIATHRWEKGGPGDDTIVIHNFGGKTLNNYELGLPSDGKWKVRFNSDSKDYSSDFGATSVWDVDARWDDKDGMPFSGRVNIPPYSTIILSRDR